MNRDMAMENENLDSRIEKPQMDKFIHKFLIELGYHGILSAGKKARDGKEYVDSLKDIQQEYIADKKPAEVDPKTRALADACLLLFNSNEFVYVY